MMAAMKRPQFSLRTLMLVVTVIAAMCGAYWFGWPAWKNHQQQVRFESAVRQLKAGMTARAAEELLPVQSNYFQLMHWQPDGNYEALSRHVLNNVVYCVLYKFDRLPSPDALTPYVSVKVFRLPFIPHGDDPADGNRNPGVTSGKMDPPPPGGILTEPYFNYFFWFVSEDRKINPGFEYELIYSDPPESSISN